VQFSTVVLKESGRKDPLDAAAMGTIWAHTPMPGADHLGRRKSLSASATVSSSLSYRWA
jgi:hypothetical protein